MQHIPKIILPIETSRVFGRDLLLGISKYARLHGPWAFYREPRGIPSKFPQLKDWHADGVIMRNSKSLKHLLKLSKPTILVVHGFELFPPMTTIKTNGEAISKMASDHLLNKGLQNFAFCGFDEYPWSVDRAKYFKHHINLAGYNVDIFVQPKSPKKRKWEYEQLLMAEWLKGLPKPVGIMACNDDRGQHVTEACKIAELRIPEDVAIIGVDNDDLICDLCDPPLTSVALNVQKAGYEAAKILDIMITSGKKIVKTIMVQPTHVKTRASTDIIATDDRELAKAISFIRQNFRKNIKVNDVVESTALSRRTLEMRFKNILSRTINHEIKRVRVEHICKLLMETDLSIADIAYNLGFCSFEHISRYFQSETGKSLREYRKMKNVSKD